MRGKVVILSIVAVALLATGFGIWFQRQKTYLVLQWLGPDAARCISRAEQVFFLEFPSEAPQGEFSSATSIIIADKEVAIIRRMEVTKEPGLVHLRHALTQNASYQWQAPNSANGDWEFALQFVYRSQTSTLLFDLNRQMVCHLETGESVALAEHFGAGVQHYRADL